MPPAESTSSRILIVDDEPANVRLLERLLEHEGYTAVASTTDPRRAIDLYRTFGPDLVLLDLLMPHLDGMALLGELRTEIPEGVYLPVLVLTADAGIEARRRALAGGATDFLTKPFEQFEVLLRIRNLLQTRALYVELATENRALDEMVRQRTERLLQSEKVATMGSLLAGVAHELNNPLAALMGQAQLLRETTEDPVVSRRAQKIDQAAERCVRIVRNFLALARQRPPERAAVHLDQIVRGAVELLAYELRTDDVEVVLQLGERLPVLWADPHQLHQVIVNVVGNAHHAMRRRPPPRRLTMTTRHDPGRTAVVLEVSDTGPGIPADIRARIFEPFFTTKPPGEGTGLGLSLCRSVVEEHGGTITVESEPGQGTTFTFALPVAPPPAAASQPEGAEPIPFLGPKKVLVIDDEPEVAAVLAEVLEREGHQVDVATNGAVALERLARWSYDLVVSDTKMPVLDGEALFEEIGRRFPELRGRMIFLTGDVLSREKREFIERAGVPFLAKPYDLDEVRRLVRRVLVGLRS